MTKLQKIRDENADHEWNVINICKERPHAKTLYKRGFDAACAEWEKIVGPLVNAIEGTLCNPQRKQRRASERRK